MFSDHPHLCSAGVSNQESALARTSLHVGLAHLEAVADQARDYAAAARAKNTIRAYRADWADFTAWCDQLGLQSLPAAPDTVALYLTSQAGTKKTSTLQRRLSAISQAHQVGGL